MLTHKKHKILSKAYPNELKLVRQTDRQIDGKGAREGGGGGGGGEAGKEREIGGVK